MPPMSWTSKWRISSLRFAISRQTAKASGRRSSRVAPSARRFLNSSVFARRSPRSEALDLALVLAAEDLVEQDVDHDAAVPTASLSILNYTAQRNSDSP